MKLSMYDGKKIDLDNLAYLVSALIDPGKSVTDNRVTYTKDDIMDFLDDLEYKVKALENEVEACLYQSSQEAEEEYRSVQGKF